MTGKVVTIVNALKTMQVPIQAASFEGKLLHLARDCVHHNRSAMRA